MAKITVILERFAEFIISKVGDGHGWQKRGSDLLGISPQQMNNILTGRSPIGATIREKYRKAGGNEEWLSTGRKPIAIVMEAPSNYIAVTTVPLLGRILATPEGKQYFEDLPEGINVPYFRGNYFALVIENDSLINAPDGDHSMELYPFDICIFEKDKQPKNGDIVAVQMKQRNNRMVKILKHVSKDEADLLSANKFRNYPAVRIHKEDVAVWGVFVTKLKMTKAEKRKLGIKD